MNIIAKDIINTVTSVSCIILIMTLATGFHVNQPTQNAALEANAKNSSAQAAETSEKNDGDINRSQEATVKSSDQGDTAQSNVHQKNKNLLSQATAEHVKKFTDKYKKVNSKKVNSEDLTSDHVPELASPVNNAATLATLRTIKN